MRTKMLMASVMTLAVLSCFMTLAVALTPDPKVTQTPTGAILIGTDVMLKIQTEQYTGPAAFEWYAPANHVGDDPIGPTTYGETGVALDGTGSASSTHTLNIEGEWLIVIKLTTGQTVPRRVNSYIPVQSVIPELPLIGTAGASIAMIGGLAYKMKRKKA